MIRLAAIVLSASTLCVAHPAGAQDAWPTREVKMIVPFPPGSGATDAVARLVADKLREEWSQPIVLLNIPGAAGSVGIARLARSAPDGYTFATSGDAAIVNNVSLYKSLAYDPVKDLAPIAMIGRTANLLVVRADKGPRSFGEFLEAARARPGGITFTSNGYGTSQHMAIEQLKRLAAVEVVHAPSPGTAVQDLIGGHVDAAFMNMPAALPQVQAGRLRALAQTGRIRSPMAPDVPTVAELGLPGFEAVTWAGVFAPAGTSEVILRRVNADVIRVLGDPTLRRRMAELGVELAEPMSGEALADFIRAEIPRVRTLVRASGIQLD